MQIKLDFEGSTISAIKSICQIDKINIEFKEQKPNFYQINQNNYFTQKIILSTTSNQEQLKQNRGFVDLAISYLKFHNPQIHLNNFTDPKQQKLFDDLEKFRLIKQSCQNFKGIALNLEPIITEAWQQIEGNFVLPFLLLSKPDATISDLSIFKQLNLETKVYWKNLDLEISTRMKILANITDNQQNFSIQALDLISFLQKLDQKPKNLTSKPQQLERTTDFNSQNNTQKVESFDIKQEEGQSKDKNSKIEENPQSQQIKDTAAKKEEQTAKISPLKEELVSPSGCNKKNVQFTTEYKIFTKKFDQIVRAKDITSLKELETLRRQLDYKLKKIPPISKNLVNKLKRKLLAKKNIYFEINKEDGFIDRKKFTQIITKPFSHNNYFNIQDNDYQNTVLSILLDNSGSMRGLPIIMVAMAAEIIAKIFEGFAIKTEILGFTTCEWRGGKSKKLWEEQGKVTNPGRLSDLRHIIYKSEHQTLKKSRNNLGLMLRDGILKENIDGEALIWASSRLKAKNEKRKILLVISDGNPIDDSTNSNNQANILNDHLHQTIQRLEKHSKIEIAAIGIGHNVGDFYQNSITVKNLEEVGNVMIKRIIEII